MFGLERAGGFQDLVGEQVQFTDSGGLIKQWRNMFVPATRENTQSPGAVKWKHADRRGSHAACLLLRVKRDILLLFLHIDNQWKYLFCRKISST